MDPLVLDLRGGPILAALILVPLASVVSETATLILFLLLLVTYVPAYAAVSIWVMSFRCPRCHERWFKLVSFVPAPFTAKCARCDLPRAPLS
jgi:hypothetical protein